LIRSSAYLYVEGYQWSSDPARDASIYAMELAKKNSVPVAFTYSDPFMVKMYLDSYRDVTERLVDTVFCNGDEARELTGAKSAQEAAIEIAKIARLVCVTIGADGALVVQGDRVEIVPACKVERVVDTTGAGDQFAAGVLRGLTAGMDAAESAAVGCRMAEAVISQIGARVTSDISGIRMLVK